MNQVVKHPNDSSRSLDLTESTNNVSQTPHWPRVNRSYRSECDDHQVSEQLKISESLKLNKDKVHQNGRSSDRLRRSILPSPKGPHCENFTFTKSSDKRGTNGDKGTGLVQFCGRV